MRESEAARVPLPRPLLAGFPDPRAQSQLILVGGGERGRGGPKASDILAENPLTSSPSQCFLVLFLTLRPRTPHPVLF